MRQIAAIRRCDTSPRLYCCCDKALSLSLSLRYVARIQTSLNSCDRSQRQNSVAATMIFTWHTRRFVAAICRGDVSQRFVASCVSAFMISEQAPSDFVISVPDLALTDRAFRARKSRHKTRPIKLVCSKRM